MARSRPCWPLSLEPTPPTLWSATACADRAPGRRQPVVPRRGLARSDFGRRSDTRRKRLALLCRTPRTVEVPSSIEGLFCRASIACRAPARRSLQSAAILGPEFEFALLRAVDAEAGDPAMLEMLCDTEWLVPVRPAGTQSAQSLPHPARRYRFASTLAHDVVYQNLLLRRRTELHQRAGMALEGLHGTSPTRLEDLEALCHHFSLGEDRGARRALPGRRGRLGARHLCQ